MKRRTRFAPGLALTVIVGLMVLALLGLGTWQVFRLQEKTAYIKTITENLARPPVALPAVVEDPQAWRHARVKLRGVFLHPHRFLLQPRTWEGKSGYHVLTPFRRTTGQIVMVNRGWVSDETLPRITQPRGTLTVEGVVQVPYQSFFTPPNNPQAGQWYWPDIPAMAAAAGLGNVAPVVVSVSERAEGVYPIGGVVHVEIPNNHRHYAIFWYSMAVVLLVIFGLSQRKEVA